MKSEFTIGVVITNYNTWEKALLSVKKHLHYADAAITKITLVDDHSRESWKGGLNRKIELIRNPSNLGLVKSANIGFRQQKADIVLLFDSDAYPTMDYTDVILKEFRSDPALAILGFTTHAPDGTISGSSELEPDAWSLLLGQKLHGWYRRIFRKRDDHTIVYSCAMAVRRQAFETVNGFDEQFDWLDLDHDLCMKLHRNGWKIKRSEDLHAVHEGGGTPQQVSDRALRFYRNRWYLLRKHHKIKHVFPFKHLILLRLLLEYLFLRFCGNLAVPNRSVLKDKLQGRKSIIKYCWSNYK